MSTLHFDDLSFKTICLIRPLLCAKFAHFAILLNWDRINLRQNLLLSYDIVCLVYLALICFSCCLYREGFVPVEICRSLKSAYEI